MKKLGLYEWSVILFFIVIPIGATIIESSTSSVNIILNNAFKWFVFSGIGLRLGSAGVKQVIQPEFTARKIFKINDRKATAIVRELGFANICFGLIGIISLWVSSFRIPAAIAGGLYFGLAGFLHILEKRESGEETFAMISDLYIFFIILFLMIMNII